MAAMLARVQRGLEALYRVDTGVAVGDFVINAEARDELVTTRRPREQLLVSEDGGGDLDVALFVDPHALANLERNDPATRLGNHNLGDFLLAIEGVSHFVYAILCARQARPVSQLELELQAEVDKYIVCLLISGPSTEVSAALRHRLFGDADYEPDLDREERDRYRAANDNAARYATFLETEYLAPRRVPQMLGELRRFYRDSLAAKLAAIGGR